MTKRIRLGFLASHRGSNMQAILDACARGEIAAEPVLVLSNNKSSGALERARSAGIPAIHLSRKKLAERFDQRMRELLEEHRVDLVILAGFMQRIGPLVLQGFERRIINIHPALLPKHGGEGMYGMFVHEAVIAAGEKESGATVHLVDAEYDTGPILAQESLTLAPDETAESLAQKVLAIEHRLYPNTVAKIARGEIDLDRLVEAPVHGAGR